MHDGSLATLSEVIEHYNKGGRPHVNKSDLIRPLDLTSQEKIDLVNFLKSLTDESFLTNSLFNE
jgi:cytochrome c peroxidase